MDKLLEDVDAPRFSDLRMHDIRRSDPPEECFQFMPDRAAAVDKSSHSNDGSCAVAAVPPLRTQNERIVYYSERDPKFSREVEKLRLRRQKFRVSSNGVIYTKSKVSAKNSQDVTLYDSNRSRERNRRRHEKEWKITAEWEHVFTDGALDTLDKVVEMALSMDLGLVALVASLMNAASYAEMARLVLVSVAGQRQIAKILRYIIDEDTGVRAYLGRRRVEHESGLTSGLSKYKFVIALSIIAAVLRIPHIIPLEHLYSAFAMQFESGMAPILPINLFRAVIERGASMASLAGFKDIIGSVVDIMREPIDSVEFQIEEMSQHLPVSTVGQQILGTEDPDSMTRTMYQSKLASIDADLKSLQSGAVTVPQARRLSKLRYRIETMKAKHVADIPVPIGLFVYGEPGGGKTEFCTWVGEQICDGYGVPFRPMTISSDESYHDGVVSNNTNFLGFDDVTASSFAPGVGKSGMTANDLLTLISPQQTNLAVADPKLKTEDQDQLLGLFCRSNFDFSTVFARSGVDIRALKRRFVVLQLTLKPRAEDAPGDPNDVDYRRWQIEHVVLDRSHQEHSRTIIPVDEFPAFIKKIVDDRKAEFTKRMKMRTSLCATCRFPHAQCKCPSVEHEADSESISSDTLRVHVFHRMLVAMWMRVVAWLMYIAVLIQWYWTVVCVSIWHVRRGPAAVRQVVTTMNTLNEYGMRINVIRGYVDVVALAIAGFGTVYGVFRFIKAASSMWPRDQITSEEAVDKVLTLDHVSGTTKWGAVFENVAYPQTPDKQALYECRACVVDISCEKLGGTYHMYGYVESPTVLVIPFHFYERLSKGDIIDVSFQGDTMLVRKHTIVFNKALVISSDPLCDRVALRVHLQTIFDLQRHFDTVGTGERLYVYDREAQSLVPHGLAGASQTIWVTDADTGRRSRRTVVPTPKLGKGACGTLIYNRSGRPVLVHAAGNAISGYAVPITPATKNRGFTIDRLNYKGKLKQLRPIYPGSFVLNFAGSPNGLTVLGSLENTTPKQSCPMFRTDVVCTKEEEFVYYPPIMKGQLSDTGTWQSIGTRLVEKQPVGLTIDVSAIMTSFQEQRIFDMTEYFRDNPSPEGVDPMRKLSLQEALLGVKDFDGRGNNLQPMERTTAAGSDYPGRKDYYMENPDALYRDAILFRQQLMAEGATPMTHIMSVVGKSNEVRDENKVARPIYVNPLVCLLWIRVFLLGYLEVIKLSDFESVGSNPYDEETWKKIFGSRLLKEGERAEDVLIAWNGDLAKCDQSMAVLRSHVEEVDQAVITHFTNSWSESDCAFYKRLCMYLQNVPIHVNGDVLTSGGGTSSGDSRTTHANSDGTKAVCNYVRAQLYILRAARKNDSTFGDDVMCLFRRDDPKAPRASELISSVFGALGFTVTDANDKTRKPELRPIGEVQFLKRSFRYHDDLRRYVPPLNQRSIAKSLMWWNSERADIAQAHENAARNAKLEVALWGRESFDEFCKTFPLLQSEGPSYEQCLEFYRRGEYEEILWK